ncbi:hypothetical protein ACTX06_30515, partial [Pseudomonas aeruginosa]|uniref:hypothetical protein n=1 Tax=Pseudomonas aeruginosa TaxID=287 RepID=UPI003FD451C4
GLLALAGVLGVGEGHLLHRKALRVKSADFAKSGSLFQSFPSSASFLNRLGGVFWELSLEGRSFSRLKCRLGERLARHLTSIWMGL